MKKSVIISIKGEQKTPYSDAEVLEFLTNGTYKIINGVKYISYTESELTGMDGVNTTVKIEGDERVTLTRKGKMHGQLIWEKGKRHICPYITEFGEMVMGVNTSNITSNLNNEGGELNVGYSLEINHSFASDNIFNIKIKEEKKTNEKSDFRS
jgi:uncharacterized beta-barrel protein YwiB (DUF1934 family)